MYWIVKAKRITEGMTVIYNEFNFVYRGNLNNGTGNRKHLMETRFKHFLILWHMYWRLTYMDYLSASPLCTWSCSNYCLWSAVHQALDLPLEAFTFTYFRLFMSIKSFSTLFSSSFLDHDILSVYVSLMAINEQKY